MAKNSGNKNAVAKDLLNKLLGRLSSADNCWVYQTTEPTGYGRACQNKNVRVVISQS